LGERRIAESLHRMICKNFRHPKMKKMPSEGRLSASARRLLCKESRHLGLFVRKSSRLRPRGNASSSIPRPLRREGRQTYRLPRCFAAASQARPRETRAGGRVGCFSEQKNGGPWGPPRLQKLGLIYALLRRRRPSQPKPIRAEPMSVSDAGSGAVTVGTKFVVSCSGFPFADS